MLMSRRKDFANWMFRNRETGKITLGQPSNASMKVVQRATLVGVLLPKSRVRTGFGVVAITALAAWGADELARGVNPFRRLQGALALLGIVYLARRRSR
jgi:ABC-type hemin transport system ATPase subunit